MSLTDCKFLTVFEGMVPVCLIFMSFIGFRTMHCPMDSQNLLNEWMLSFLKFSNLLVARSLEIQEERDQNDL